ncbi:MAG: serine/threonine protein kinase, partial [Deltaproteobacteria bacterium]|nr:serine/threonine protein kinase [Deltaproteobacteria bacterium]
MAHGRYTIVGKLADGGMAEIFLARQHGAEGFQKPVVLKRVLTAFSADPQFRNMFLDEAQISMSLNHGNIVQVLDVGVAGDRAFLVLELVEGWDLAQVMERAQATGPDHPWPPSLALYVTAQICRGLAYAHAKRGPDGRPLGIVHRDVSPTNVLISEQGEVKLADFGIAKAERKREQTLAGVIKGKIGFMSPEQALGRPLDARADLFSVGTVMYLMLTGRRPFDAGSELESMTLAQRAEYRPPEELNPYLSPEATEIVARAMQRDPAQRYQTADQMLLDVERVLRSQYDSAGQTELKVWLSALANRDNVPPIGRRGIDDTGGPAFIDESGELSAGSSLELSGMDGATAAAAATVVSTPTATPGGQTPQNAHVESPTAVAPVAISATSPSSSATGARPAAAGAAPRTLSNIHLRLPKRSRVGLGFVLGALCMLGVVFGIRWLAQWAGRERIGVPDWYSTASNSAPDVPTPPAAAPALVGSPVLQPPGAPSISADGAASDGVADAGTTPAVAQLRGQTEPPVPVERDEDEAQLLGQVVPGAGTVVGEDEAEGETGDSHGRSAPAKEKEKEKEKPP